jgi:hypothetical protein
MKLRKINPAFFIILVPVIFSICLITRRSDPSLRIIDYIVSAHALLTSTICVIVLLVFQRTDTSARA